MLTKKEKGMCKLIFIQRGHERTAHHGKGEVVMYTDTVNYPWHI